MSNEEVYIMTTNTKCYNCVLNPHTCLYRCGLAKEDCDYIRDNKDVSQELAILAARCTKLALQKAVNDMTDLQNEMRTLELELNTLLELGVTNADYQDIISLLQAGYEIINRKYKDDDVYTRHCTYLHDDPVDPNAPY